MDSILVPCGFILPLHPAIEQDADDAGEQRAAGRGKTHRHEGLGEEPAGQPCARHTHQQDGEGVVQKRQPRPAPGAEIAAEAELDAREQAVEDVAADVGRTGQHHRLIGGEGPHHTGGDELHQKGHHRTEAHADGDGVPEDVVRPVVLARADVLGAQRRHGGEHGAGDEEEICHAVEGLQKVREQIRQREGEDVFQHAAAGEVFFHVFRSACPLPSPRIRICVGTAGRLPFHAL